MIIFPVSGVFANPGGMGVSMIFCLVSSSWTHLGATELIGTDRFYPCVVDILDTAPLMDGCVTAAVVVSTLIVVLGIDLVKEALWDTRRRVSKCVFRPAWSRLSRPTNIGWSTMVTMNCVEPCHRCRIFSSSFGKVSQFPKVFSLSSKIPRD